MSSVKSIMIQHIDEQYTCEYIANALWYQQLARVSKITMVPYLSNSGRSYFTAYVLIDCWCETEAAYGFIQRLCDQNREARIMHYDEEWWVAEINTHNDGDLDAGAYTTTFSRDYFEAPTEPETEDEHSDEELDLESVKNITLRAHQRHFGNGLSMFV